MTENLITGFVAMAVCLTIQCIVVGALLDLLVFMEKRKMIRHTLIGMTWLLVTLMLIMLAGNILQITIWAALFFGSGSSLRLRWHFTTRWLILRPWATEIS